MKRTFGLILVITIAVASVAPAQSTEQDVFTAEQLEFVGQADMWQNWALVSFGASVGAALTAIAIDPFVGGILGILSLGGLSIFEGLSVLEYNKLLLSQDGLGNQVPDFSLPRVSGIASAGLAMGALTAISLSFDDSSGVAVVLAGICTTGAWVSGGISYFTTKAYLRENAPMLETRWR
jgi:hypothetical protein